MSSIEDKATSTIAKEEVFLHVSSVQDCGRGENSLEGEGCHEPIEMSANTRICSAASPLKFQRNSTWDFDVMTL